MVPLQTLFSFALVRYVCHGRDVYLRCFEPRELLCPSEPWVRDDLSEKREMSEQESKEHIQGGDSELIRAVCDMCPFALRATNAGVEKRRECRLSGHVAGKGDYAPI